MLMEDYVSESEENYMMPIYQMIGISLKRREESKAYQSISKEV
jgi:hypothetical protein